MRVVFLDTAYVVAVETKNDQYHAAATPHWNMQRGAPALKLVTTSFVLAEIVSLLNARRAHDRAVEVGTWLFRSPTVQLIQVDSDLFQQAWSYFVQQDDKQYSLTDCISFLVMKRMRISTAFTFDHHFRQAGFLVEP
jgi:uncharacterized protein